MRISGFRLVPVALVFGAAGCVPQAVSLEGLDCDETGACVEGYECHPVENLCVLAISRSCDGSGACWSEVETGVSCGVEGAFLPCGPGDECTAGCRTCRLAEWSRCEGGACTLGSVENCSECGDDCNVSVEGALPTCELSPIGAAACGYTACLGDLVDLDEIRGNGCECDPSPEVCNGEDDDCDGDIDEGLLTTWYADADGDGHGDAGVSVEACDPPAGHVTTSDDCADVPGSDPACNGLDGVLCNPSLTGADGCDGADNDCDGSTDEDLDLWFADLDGDGHGDPTNTTRACTPPAGHVANSGDCADTPGSDPACNGLDGALCDPDNAGFDLCDGADNDCDGSTDEDLAAAADLVAGYPFDGDLLDASGLGNDAVVVDGQAAYSGGIPPSGNGISSLNLDGSTSLQLPIDPNVFSGAGPFTIVWWFKIASGGNGVILGASSPSGVQGDHAMAVMPVSGGRITYDNWYTGAARSGTGGLDDDAWHHAAVVYDGGGDFTVFLDGNVDGTGTDFTPNLDATAPGTQITVSKMLDPGWQGDFGSDGFFSGLVDDLGIYAHALDTCEVNRVMTAGFD